MAAIFEKVVIIALHPIFSKFSIQKLHFQLCTGYQETPSILLIQVNRFSVSDLHGGKRKNNHPFGVCGNVKLGLMNCTLLGLVEHHGVFIDSGHYVSCIRQSNRWCHCDDRRITETNLLTLSDSVCLMFCAEEVGLGT